MIYLETHGSRSFAFLMILLLASLGCCFGQRSESTAIPQSQDKMGSWAEKWWELGAEDYDAGDYGKCRRDLARYLSFRPDDEIAWAIKGLAEFELGERQTALADLQTAGRLHLTSQNKMITIVHVHEILLLDYRGDFERAFAIIRNLDGADCSELLAVEGAGLTGLRIAKPLATQTPKRRQMILATGSAVCHAATNASGRADGEFLRVLQDNPSTPQLHYLYGCFLIKDRPEEGLRQFLAELLLSPSHVPTLVQVASEYLRLGEMQKASLYGQRAVEIDPRNAQAQYVLGSVLIDTNQIKSGLLHLRTAARLDPGNRSMLWALAAGYAQSGNATAAQRVRLQLSKLKTASAP